MKPAQNNMTPSTRQIAIYQTADGRTLIDVKVNQGALWLALFQMAELFDRNKSVISRHLKNIFDTGELSREATVAKTATVQSEGGRQVGREIEYFNLDAVISVGDRVNSIKGTQATQRLQVAGTRMPELPRIAYEVELCRALSRYARTLQTTGFPLSRE